MLYQDGSDGSCSIRGRSYVQLQLDHPSVLVLRSYIEPQARYIVGRRALDAGPDAQVTIHCHTADNIVHV